MRRGRRRAGLGRWPSRACTPQPRSPPAHNPWPTPPSNRAAPRQQADEARRAACIDVCQHHRSLAAAGLTRRQCRQKHVGQHPALGCEEGGVCGGRRGGGATRAGQRGDVVGHQALAKEWWVVRVGGLGETGAGGPLAAGLYGCAAMAARMLAAAAGAWLVTAR